MEDPTKHLMDDEHGLRIEIRPEGGGDIVHVQHLADASDLDLERLTAAVVSFFDEVDRERRGES